MAFLARGVSSRLLSRVQNLNIKLEEVSIHRLPKIFCYTSRTSNDPPPSPIRFLSSTAVMKFRIDLTNSNSRKKKTSKSIQYHILSKTDPSLDIDEEESYEDSTENKKGQIKLSSDTSVTKRKYTRFSEEEDELIIKFVKIYGDTNETFQLLADELGRGGVQYRYRKLAELGFLKSNKKIRRKTFGKSEDKLILDYIKIHGTETNVFKSLAQILDRTDWKSVRNRYYRIKANPLNQSDVEKYKRIPFSEEEDKLIINYIETFGQTKETLDRLAIELHRNTSAIRGRYSLVTSPALLTGSSTWTIKDDKALMESVLKVQYIIKIR
jgi:hypothetical protein